MFEISPLRIIRDARQFTHAVSFSVAEIFFVGACNSLNDEEKLLWFFLATLSADNALLKRLNAMDFIHIEGLPILHNQDLAQEMIIEIRLFKILLPPEGLLALKRAPKCQSEDFVPPKKGIYQRSKMMVNLLKKIGSTNGISMS